MKQKEEDITKRNVKKKEESCIEEKERGENASIYFLCLHLLDVSSCVRDSFSPLPPLPPPPPHEFLALSREYEPEGGNNLHYNKYDVDR